MDIKNVKYVYEREDNGEIITNPKKVIVNIHANVNGKNCFIPLDPNNTHYAEILKQVKEGTLTIKDAD